jgi:hypothetical protein
MWEIFETKSDALIEGLNIDSSLSDLKSEVQKTNEKHINNVNNNVEQSSENYNIIWNDVFYLGHKLIWADAESFMAYQYYWKDNETVFYNWNQILSADSESFKILEYPEYAKDSKSVFRWWKVIWWADPETFKLINKDFSIDKNNVWYWWDRIIWINSNKFKITNDLYWESESVDWKLVIWYRWYWGLKNTQTSAILKKHEEEDKEVLN